MRASDEIAARAIIVQAVDECAAAFYRHFGSESWPLSHSTLMRLLEIATRVLGAN